MCVCLGDSCEDRCYYLAVFKVLFILISSCTVFISEIMLGLRGAWLVLTELRLTSDLFKKSACAIG